MGRPRPFAGLVLAAATVVGVGIFAAAPPALAQAVLTVSPNPVATGGVVSLSGTGFDQCIDPSTAVTTVRLSWVGLNFSIVATGRSGTFAGTQTVPSTVIPWTYMVVAQCYDASTGSVDAVLTSTDVTVQGQQQCTSLCTPSLALSESPVHAGDTITITGSGYLLCWQAQSQVQLLWDGATWTTGPVPDSSGQFTASATVPASSAIGFHKFAVTCTDPSTRISIAGTGQPIQVVSLPTRSASPSSSATATGSPSPSNSATQNTRSSAPGSVTTVSSGGPLGGIIGGVGAGLFVALLLGYLVVRSRHRSARQFLGPEQVRAVAAGAADPPSATTSSRPGATSVSLRFEPQRDLNASQKFTEG